jgi:hypothetical protein
LGDDRQTPQYIETVTRRGYRLVAPVTVVQPSDADGPPEQQISASATASHARPRSWVGRGALLERLESVRTIAHVLSPIAAFTADRRSGPRCTSRKK